MSAKELLYALGKIDDKFIKIGAPEIKNGEKRLLIKWFALAACLCLVLVGGGMWYFGIHNPTLQPVIDIPEHNAIGGDGNFEYERAYEPKLYQLDSALMDYVVESGGTDLYEWLEQESKALMKSKYNISDPEYDPILLQTIKKYNIPKDEFERINNNNVAAYEESGDYNLVEQVCYTKEEVDALYSDDATRIIDAFATEYAIVVHDRIFAPGFYLNASEKELKKYDIPFSEIEKKVSILLSDGVIAISK